MNDLGSMTESLMSDHARRVASFVREYHSTPELRERCQSDPHSVLAENGVEVPLGYDVRFVADTADLHHFVLPPDPNVSLEDEDLDMVVGGKNSGRRWATPDDMLRAKHWTSFNSVARRSRSYWLHHGGTGAHWTDGFRDWSRW